MVQGGSELAAFLHVPKRPLGLVIFAHGSGSSRHSTRNQFVAKSLAVANLATLLLDLLSPEEESIDERTREFRFDIPLLAERLILATDWAQGNSSTRGLACGYFGASTGAAAALIAAAERPELTRAVVSRGGRPDLAASPLRRVRCPVLLIVGSLDSEVMALNRRAAAELPFHHEIAVVRNATHLFEEPGALAEVAALAVRWFTTYLPSEGQEQAPPTL